MLQLHLSELLAHDRFESWGVQLRVDFRTIGSCYVIVAASMQDRIFTTTWSSMGFGKPYFNNSLAIQMHSRPLLQHLCVIDVLCFAEQNYSSHFVSQQLHVRHHLHA